MLADKRLVVGFVLDRDVPVGDEVGLLDRGGLLKRLLFGTAVRDRLC